VFLHLLYYLYERRLLRQVRLRPQPQHVGLILDGNRRYGRRHGINDPHELYRQGADKLDVVIAWCVELGIPALTLWVLSTENLNRAPGEVSGIVTAIERKMLSLAEDQQIHCHNIRVRAVGRMELLPQSTRSAIARAEEATKDYTVMVLTIAAAYGGREEIADAVKAMLCEQSKSGASLETIAQAVTPDAISRHLYSVDLPEPDLIIRTSGEIRLSGFLLWQSAFSEFYFSDVDWPAFRKIDFLRAIRSYQQRQRRFGR
jgi:short-chain Z-isoprenyl diphosphate synthase